MKFFQKIFSGKKQESIRTNSNNPKFDGIIVDDYFNSRYKEEEIDSFTLDGTLKMIESYFLDNKI